MQLEFKKKKRWRETVSRNILINISLKKYLADTVEV